MHDLNNLLLNIYEKFKNINDGHLATYIPELAKANSADFGISIVTLEGKTYGAGNCKKNFTLQSVSKPFTYALALEDHGREFIRSKIGVEPTGDAFNSLIELEEQSHRPYNPMINSGAIAASSFIKGKDAIERLQRILDLFGSFAGHPLQVDHQVFLSEKKTAHRNRAIAHLLKHFGVIDADIEESLDLYFQQCSILSNTEDLAMMAATLAGGGIQPITKKQVISRDYIRDLLSLMFTCGMYDSSGEWAYSVGLPAKSGVSGGLLVVVPGKMGIGVYSPLLDSHGHSIRGVKAIEELTHSLNLNVFSAHA